MNLGGTGAAGGGGAGGARGAAHTDRVIVSWFKVTVPFCAKSRPSMFAPWFTEIEVSARMFPLNTAVVSMEAVLSRQKTLQACALPVSCT